MSTDTIPDNLYPAMARKTTRCRSGRVFFGGMAWLTFATWMIT